MRRSGKKPSLVAMAPDEKALLEAAADALGVPLSHFLLQSGLAAAREILKK
jgi:uncharacterized protein (DUF1778 family)